MDRLDELKWMGGDNSSNLTVKNVCNSIATKLWKKKQLEAGGKNCGYGTAHKKLNSLSGLQWKTKFSLGKTFKIKDGLGQVIATYATTIGRL
jgi:hypothetical protein